MNKKGFVFVETIIVIALVTSALVYVYSTFNKTLQSSKIRLYYDDPVYIYKTYVIRNLLVDNYNMDSVYNYIKNNNNKSFTTIGIDFESLFINGHNKDELSDVIDNFNINRMVVFKKNSLKEIRNCNSSNNNKFCHDLENISVGFSNYLKNLYIDSTIYDNEEEFNNHEYILAIEYNNGNENRNQNIKYYSWVVL